MLKVRVELVMKQTKKLTRNQREFLEKNYSLDIKGVRLIEETKDYIKVQLENKEIKVYSKEI